MNATSPAPWHRLIYADAICIVDDDPNCPVEIATIKLRGAYAASKVEAEANARLIEQAPALLAVVRRLIEWDAGGSVAAPDADDNPSRTLRDICDHARRAVARATMADTAPGDRE